MVRHANQAMNDKILEITNRIIERSARPRAWYKHMMAEQKAQFEADELGPRGRTDGCSNCAHAFARLRTHKQDSLKL